MPSMFDPATRERFRKRIGKLSPKSERRWGTMAPQKMICHLGDQVRLALGELDARPIPGPMRYAPMRWLAINVIPWPHGFKGPPETFTTNAREWERDIVALESLLEEFAARSGQRVWPEHPVFGRMTGPLWARVTCKHFDHHLRQFGV